jgi:hypothetical protein
MPTSKFLFSLKMRPRNRQILLLILLLLLTITGGILYINIVPPWQSPDEPTHFEYVQLLAESRNLRTQSLQEQIIISMDKHNFWRFVGHPRPQPLPKKFDEISFLRLSQAQTQIGRKPPLYYVIASLFLKLYPHQTIIFKLYLLRSLSLFFSINIVVLIFLTAKLILPKDYNFPLTVAALVAFLPEFILIGTSVSLDPLANLVSAAFIYFIIRVQVLGLNILRLLILLLLIITGTLVTYKCLMLIPIFLFGIAIYLCFQPQGLKKWRSWLYYCALILLASVFIYHSFIRISPSNARILIINTSRFFTNMRNLLDGNLHLASFYYPWFHNELFKSFWIKFGWVIFTLKPIYYHVLKIISLSALIGLLISFIKSITGRKKLSPEFKRSLFTLLLANVIVLAGYYIYWGVGYRLVTSQGRHLFISLTAWAILFVFGLRELTPKKIRVGLYLFLVVGILLLNGISLFAYILPTFHQ